MIEDFVQELVDQLLPDFKVKVKSQHGKSKSIRVLIRSGPVDMSSVPGTDLILAAEDKYWFDDIKMKISDYFIGEAAEIIEAFDKALSTNTRGPIRFQDGKVFLTPEAAEEYDAPFGSLLTGIPVYLEGCTFKLTKGNTENTWLQLSQGIIERSNV